MARLDESAMLVRLSIHIFTARKYDRQVSNEIAESKGAQHDAGNYNKLLLPKQHVLKLVRTEASARNCHYHYTLPWDTKDRILASNLYFEYISAMGEHKTNFWDTVNEFVDMYPQLIETRKQEIGTMFKLSDYPSTSDLKDYFEFETIISPVPTTGDFRVSLKDGEMAEIKNQFEDRFEQSKDLMVRNMWERVYLRVKNMVDKLSDEDGKFHDTLIGHIITLTSLLSEMNIIKDPDLEAVRKELEEKICTINPQDLRDDINLRRHTTQIGKEILEKSPIYVGK